MISFQIKVGNGFVDPVRKIECNKEEREVDENGKAKKDTGVDTILIQKILLPNSKDKASKSF